MYRALLQYECCRQLRIPFNPHSSYLCLGSPLRSKGYGTCRPLSLLAAQMAIASAPLSEAPFLVGTAISVWQNSGGEPTNWATWAGKRNMFGWSTIKCGDKASGSPCRVHERLRSSGWVNFVAVKHLR